jgi:NAD(P)-dependent dehydrogenase (short-subunit alcohol dehydrogenase family)
MTHKLRTLVSLHRLAVAAAVCSGLLSLLASVRAAEVPASKAADAAATQGTVLVTGANRGIGLELAKQFLAGGYDVIGTARAPAEATELRASGARVVALDVTDATSVAALVESLQGTAIDILVNNAGIFPRTGTMGSIATITFDEIEQTLETNTIGPMRVTQALLPNLRAGKRKLIVSISSRLGSIEFNTNGNYYGYRESKAALNVFMRSLAMELKSDGFTCVAMSPGWVRTDMGGPQATLSPEESVKGILAVLESLEPEDSGTFRSYDGAKMPW